MLIEKIVKKGSKWQVQSEKGRNMGTYDTKEEAKERLRQVEYFKHKNESLNEELKPIPRGTTIIYLPTFERSFRNLDLTDNDLEELEDALFTSPPEASLGSGVYKFRWSPKKWARGQSKGARVIYIFIIAKDEVYLTDIYILIT